MRFSNIANSVSRFLILFVLITASSEVFSQTLSIPSQDNSTDKWDLNFNLGATQFFGDASNHSYFQKWKGESRLGIQISVKKMFSPVFGAGLSLYSTGINSIKDRKSDGTIVDYTLGGNYDDLTAFAYANFSNLFGSYNSDRKISIYGTLGFGVSTWNTALTDNISGAVIHSGTTVGTTKFANKALAIPFGAGVDYRINDNWSVHANGTLTTILSDYVDEWKDGAKYDQLFFTNIGVTYYIHPGKHESLLGRKKSRRNRKSQDEMNKRPIPIFDYMVNPEPAPVESGGKSEVDMMTLPVQPATSPESPAPETKQQQPDAGLQYRVQILASRVPLRDPLLLQAKYKFDYPVKVFHQDGLYRYTVGQFSSYQVALSESRKLNSKGVNGAFVTAYRDGLRVPLTNAMMNQQVEKPNPVIF
ncbi:MAG: outer membrane beta-barrel protein [Bacteroidales bacterium]|nr:outer membrane beta-barrel protein [Bacteroidales bacterium]